MWVNLLAMRLQHASTVVLYNMKTTLWGMLQILRRCNFSTHKGGKSHSDVEGLGGIE